MPVLHAILLSLLILSGCSSTKTAIRNGPVAAEQGKFMLFNGENLDNWKLFLPNKNVDVNTVWQVKNGIIHCKGKPAGYMRTKTDYSNYKLHVEWRWPKGGGNNGVLIHMSGPDKVWPRSIECQLMAGNAGDFFVIDGTDFKEHLAGGPRVKSRRTKKLKNSSEKPLGQWNVYEIYCDGTSIRPYVNGILQNKATNPTVTSGKICLQSEGTPIEFRNIWIEKIKYTHPD